MGSLAVLARLLTPGDFGLIAMVTVVTGFVALFKDMGLSMATVQKAHINHAQVSTLFWINMAISAVIMALTALIAPGVAWFYHEPRLTWITLAMAAAFIFGGLTIQHQALLRRQMRFGTLTLIEVVSMLVGAAMAIIFAWYGAGYWALVVMQLGIAITTAVGVWFVSGWRPGLPVRGSGVRPMLTFGGYLTAFSFVNYLGGSAPSVLLGRFCGDHVLGLYSKAYSLLLLPIKQINGPVSLVGMPALSRLQKDPVQYRRYYSKIVSLVLLLTMPMAVLLFVTADDVIDGAIDVTPKKEEKA
ncbi:MAG: lipopolysaccharide biosynthesis protein [Planctomycetes bacterium]|nr:lipopolysaccharide biosynthesis protein [Planctomycetota bacterium]